MKDINFRLYEINPEEPSGIQFKREIMEYIGENMKFSGDSGYEKGYRSNDYYQPDEPEHAWLEVDGVLPISELEAKFGKFTEEDLENLSNELEEDEIFSDYVINELYHIKVHPIESFNIDTLEVTVNKQSITIHADTDIYGYSNEYDDY